MTKGLIGRLLGDEEISAKTAPEPLSQLPDPALDERVSLYLRAIHGKRDFEHAEYSDARNRVLNAMAANVAVKLGNDLPDISGMPVDPEYGVTAAKTDVYPAARAASPGVYRTARALMPHFSDISARPLLAAPPRAYRAATAAPLRHIHMADEEHFAAAAPEIIPPRRPPVKFSIRTMGALSIMVCAAAVIAGAGTMLFPRNDVSSSGWFAIEPRVVMSQPPREEPSPEVLAELAKVARALPTAETTSRGPSVEVQAVASGSPFKQLSPEELAELVKRGNGLIGVGTASLLPSLAASQAVTSGSPTLAAALAWYQNSR